MELLKDIKISDEEIEGKVFFKLFDKYIDFFSQNVAAIDYVKICAEYLNSIDDKVIKNLCVASIKYCNYVLMSEDREKRIFNNFRDILPLIYPACLIVPFPENDNEPIIDLELNCKWEVEHGMEWIVRKNKVLYVGPFYGEDPWNDFSMKEEGNYA